MATALAAAKEVPPTRPKTPTRSPWTAPAATARILALAASLRKDIRINPAARATAPTLATTAPAVFSFLAVDSETQSLDPR